MLRKVIDLQGDMSAMVNGLISRFSILAESSEGLIKGSVGWVDEMWGMFLCYPDTFGGQWNTRSCFRNSHGPSVVGFLHTSKWRSKGVLNLYDANLGVVNYNICSGGGMVAGVVESNKQRQQTKTAHAMRLPLTKRTMSSVGHLCSPSNYGWLIHVFSSVHACVFRSDVLMPPSHQLIHSRIHNNVLSC
jgi:hypothetical protein